MTIPTADQQRAMPVASAAMLSMQGNSQRIKTIALLDALGRVNPEMSGPLQFLREAMTADHADDVESALDWFSREAQPVMEDMARTEDPSDYAFEERRDALAMAAE